MKNLKLFIAAFALVFAVQVSANNEKPIKVTAQLQSELIELMGTKVPFSLENGELTAEVLFTVNSQGEVVILKITVSLSFKFVYYRYWNMFLISRFKFYNYDITPSKIQNIVNTYLRK